MSDIPDYIPQGSIEEIKEGLMKWVGKEVKRGPTWKWSRQDEDSYGNRMTGIVQGIGGKWGDYESVAIGILWKNGNRNTYRVGGEDADVILVHPEEIYKKTKEYENKAYMKLDVFPGDRVLYNREGISIPATVISRKEAQMSSNYNGDSISKIYIKYIEDGGVYIKVVLPSFLSKIKSKKGPKPIKKIELSSEYYIEI